MRVRIPNAAEADFRAGGVEAARQLLGQMHGADGARQFTAAHDPYAVGEALITALSQMKASGATDEALKAWQTGFSEVMDGYAAIAPAERSRLARDCGGTARANLFTSTAILPALNLVDDRTQLALVGLDSRKAIAASARTAVLEDCRRLGEEHGEQDARENVVALRSGFPIDEVNGRQLGRALRRIQNLTAAGVSGEKLQAYVDAARQAFRQTVLSLLRSDTPVTP